jgi:hypothetical protein
MIMRKRDNNNDAPLTGAKSELHRLSGGGDAAGDPFSATPDLGFTGFFFP